MNLSILSTNFLIYVCMIFSALSFYVVTTIYKLGPKEKPKSKKALLGLTKQNRLVFLFSLIISLALAVIIYAFAARFTNSSIPSSVVLMCLPFTVMTAVLLISIFYKRQMRTASGCAFVVALIFSLVLVNDYYHYFETIGQVLGISNARLYQAGTDDVTINYNEPNNQTVLNKASIQNAIYNLSHKNEKGNLYKLNIPGTISHFHPRNAYVYVPPAYSTPARINLPVIVLTAGTPGTPDNWPGAGLEGIMDQFAQSHDGITPLVFVVDNTGSVTNDTECVNSPRGNVETYLSVDVPSYIKNHFRVIDSPQHWAIGGLSMGGMCSLMLTLRHTDVYHYFIDLGGEIGPEVGSRETTINTLFNGSSQKWASHQPALLLKTRRYKGIGGFFGGGNQDAVNVTQAQSQLYQESKAAGIDAVSEVVNGAHTFNVWAQTYKDSLPWISDRIGATQCGPSCL